MPTTRLQTSGTVKWYDPRKGYGYAARRGAPDVFLHYGAFRGDGLIQLKPGQEVEFLVESTPRGDVAHEIRVPGGRS